MDILQESRDVKVAQLSPGKVEAVPEVRVRRRRWGGQRWRVRPNLWRLDDVGIPSRLDAHCADGRVERYL